MRLGLRKTSLVDYPGRVAATVFVPGCSLRCPWCHNGDLVLRAGAEGPAARESDDAPGQAEPLPGAPGRGARGDGLLPPDEVLAIVARRSRLLGGVVVTGGEPLAWRGLVHFVRDLKATGLALKLDTNGMHPEDLSELLSRPETSPDFVALDLKTRPEAYAGFAASREFDAEAALLRSMEILAQSGVDFEYRSLALPGYFGEPELRSLAPLLEATKPWRISAFRPGNCLDPAWNRVPQSADAEVGALRALERELRPESPRVQGAAGAGP